MNEEYNFDDMLDSYGSQDQMPSNFDFSSMDFTPDLLNLPDMAPANYAVPPIDMSQYGFGSMDMGPGATQLSSVDQAYLNQLNGSMPAEKGFMDYAKEYGPYLLSPNPLASILINKLSGVVGDAIGGKEGQLAETGTSSLLSGASPKQALINTALSEAGGRTAEGISSLLPRSENPSLAEEYLSKAAPNVGAQLITALLTGNTGSLAPMVRNSLLGTGKSMAGNKVFGSLTGD
jgi:hypothetical protein